MLQCKGRHGVAGCRHYGLHSATMGYSRLHSATTSNTIVAVTAILVRVVVCLAGYSLAG